MKSEDKPISLSKEINKLKQEGNELFAKQQYEEAIRVYQKAITKCYGDKSLSELKTICTLNIAACYIKLKKFKDCIFHCEQVLMEQPKNVKANYRAAVANFELHEYEKSKKYLNIAKQECKDEKQLALIQKMLDKIEQEDKKFKAMRKKMFAGMFDKIQLYPDKQMRIMWYKRLFTPRNICILLLIILVLVFFVRLVLKFIRQ